MNSAFAPWGFEAPSPTNDHVLESRRFVDDLTQMMMMMPRLSLEIASRTPNPVRKLKVEVREGASA